MRISDLIKMGLKNLSRRKARTALTIVGVVIGTISIVVMVSIGIGMNTNFTKYVMELGSLTSITVNKNEYKEGQNGEYNEYKQNLNDSLVESIRQLDHVKAVSPVYTGQITIICKNYETGATLYGIDLTSLENFAFPNLTYGSYPIKENSEAIVIGSDVLTHMYNPSNFRGPGITVDLEKDKLFYRFNDYNYEQNFEIEQKKAPIQEVYQLEQTGSYDGYDWSCYMDINQYRKIYTEYAKKYLKKVDQNKALKSLKEYGQIKVNVDNVKNVKKVQDEILALGFQSSSLSSSMYEPMQETSKMMQMVLGGVGAVSMIVSAISIANTMIMSIYERTKEIGVMKVLGCIITDIKKLFLFEAGMIGLIGGIIGISLSYIASYFINKFGAPLFQALMQSGGAYGEVAGSKFSIIPIWLPFAAAGFAILVGILSGYYPASRATKISAIEAMKSDG